VKDIGGFKKSPRCYGTKSDDQFVACKHDCNGLAVSLPSRSIRLQKEKSENTRIVIKLLTNQRRAGDISEAMYTICATSSCEVRYPDAFVKKLQSPNLQ
jgi:hypothetical protein